MRIDEIADGIFRLSTPVPPSAFPGGFTFNQYLVLGDEPLIFHTGHRRLFRPRDVCHSGTVSPDPPAWAGKSRSLASPSRIGSTASA